MGPKPFPLRALGVSLRLGLLLGVGPTSGAAQATGGFTTAFALATEAAVKALSTWVYPVALYAATVIGPVEVGRAARAATDAPGRSPANCAGLLAYAS